MILRSSKYAPFLEHVERYFEHLFPLLASYTYIVGGPIIAVQVENEFGSYGKDVKYLNFIVELLHKHKVDSMMFTSDGAKHLQNGSLPELLATINLKKNVVESVEKLRQFQPGRPVMITEFWNGWFDHWGELHHVMSVEEFKESVDLILSLNISINFYMFVGGTNFGFYNGANEFVSYNIGYHPTITSYDYDAVVSESGDCGLKYDTLRSLLIKHGIANGDYLPSVPRDPGHIEYNIAKVESFMPMNELVKFLQTSITLPEMIEMEFLNINNNGGQSFGWLLYSTTFDKFSASSKFKISGKLQNRCLVYVNGKFVGELYDIKSPSISASMSLSNVYHNNDGYNSIEILVENMGRVNYGAVLEEQRRGFRGEVSVDNTVIRGWTHVSFEFGDEFIEMVSKSEYWKSFEFDSSTIRNYPAVYRVLFEVYQEVPRDTYLDMYGWCKGIVIVNKFIVGRYWRVGPQRTLYVPAPLLRKGTNEILIFELEKAAKSLKLSSVPILDERW